MSVPDRNNTDFPKENKVFIDSITEEDDFLKRYQYITLRYMQKYPDARGLLLYLKYGLGKTILSIALATMLYQKFPDRNIIFFGPKSLHKNFKDSWSRYVEHRKLAIDPDIIKFVSSNSSKSYAALTEIDTDEQVDEKLEAFGMQIKKNPNFLENSIFICDEAHLLFNSICNGATNALKIYDKIMETKKITIFFLTGNFISKRAFEVVPCFNMLSGYTNYKKKTTLFPENELKFNSYFIDEKTKAMKNMNIFENRILGLVSHYSDSYSGKSPDLPEVKDIEYVKVEMSAFMLGKYEIARDMERAEVKFKQTSERFSSKSAITSTYRIRTRLLSNFVYPDEVLGPQIGKRIQEKHYDRINFKDYYENLETYSPKAQALFEDIKKYPDQLQMIYAFSVNEAIFMISKLLQVIGYSEFNLETHNQSPGTETGTTKETREKKQKTYALFTGNEPPEVRNVIFDIFRSPENAHGEIIQLLLFSDAGAEGIDSRNVRRVHVFGPSFTWSKMEQIFHRAIRYRSHVGLPESERNVQIRIYITVYPKDANIKDTSTDEELLNISVKNDIINKEVLKIVAKCSFDCPAYSKTCKMCIPTDRKLFHEDISQDFTVTDPCQSYKETEVTATEFVFNGKKYYYTSDPKSKKLKVYEYSDKLSGYVESDDAAVYAAIISGL